MDKVNQQGATPRREASYENSFVLRLETLNAMVALAKSIGWNCYETPKSITVILERQDGTTVTEYMPDKDVKQVVEQYISEKNALPACVLTEELLQVIKEYLKNEKEN